MAGPALTFETRASIPVTPSPPCTSSSPAHRSPAPQTSLSTALPFSPKSPPTRTSPVAMHDTTFSIVWASTVTISGG